MSSPATPTSSTGAPAPSRAAARGGRGTPPPPRRGSRGAVVAGNAVHAAALAVRQKILKLAAEHFECAEEDLEIANGEVSVVGVPGQSIKLGELAVKANPM